jgi:hypothetical protein
MNMSKKQVRTIYATVPVETTHKGNITSPQTPTIYQDSGTILDINFIKNHPVIQEKINQPSRQELYYPLPSDEQEEQIRARDKGICQICGKHGKDVDHIVPLEISHNNDPSNLRVLCRVCNLRRGRHCWSKATEQPFQLGMGEFFNATI